MTISAAATLNPTLPLPLEDIRRPDAKWFSGGGCVVPEAGSYLVFVRGTLVGRFDAQDRGPRNVVLMGLATDAKVHLGQLAAAFDISSETLRLMRRVYETEGMAPLLERASGGGESRVKAWVRRRLEKFFDAGATVSEAPGKLPKHQRVSRATVGRVRRDWQAHKKGLEGAPAALPVASQLCIRYTKQWLRRAAA
ncbi:MAG: hypothetical protein ACYC8T_24465 [Myxococcaceae bacterium]